MYEPLPVSGYVLAGGRSSRMGRDKALLELAGKPLVEHAVLKLRRICTQVTVLSGNAELERFAPVVGDLHPHCGPLGGLEAALAHAAHAWSLVLAVDLPFVPTLSLYHWVQATIADAQEKGTRVALFQVDGVAQPVLVMLHREIAPYLADSLMQGRFKLFPELVAASEDLAARRGGSPAHALQLSAWPQGREIVKDNGVEPSGPAWIHTTAEQESQKSRCFWNLNTPAEFAEAERYSSLLDT